MSTGSKFFTAIIWRGRITIKSMRIFDTYPEAVIYGSTLLPGNFVRVYELFPDKPPRLTKAF